MNALTSSVPDPLPPDREQQIQRIVKELAQCGPDSDEPVRRRLLAYGSEAISVLAETFPGGLWVDLSRPHRPLTTARQLSANARAMIAFGSAAAPHIAALMRGPRAEVRLAACLVACDLKVGELVRSLAARLQDDVPTVRNAAMTALRACAELPETLLLRNELIATLEDESKPADWRQRAAWTLGQMRDVDAVAPLIEQLADRDVASSARQALTLLAGRDLGRFRFRWRSWYGRHRDEGRVAWLIDALDQADTKLRARVIEELILATGVGYDRRRAVTTREQSRELAEFYREWAAGNATE